MRRGQ